MKLLVFYLVQKKLGFQVPTCTPLIFNLPIYTFKFIASAIIGLSLKTSLRNVFTSFQ